MKSIDLVVVGGAKASQKAVFPLITGKNIVGSDKDCNCLLSWKQVQSKHFELLVAKSGDITLIPQVDGMQLQMPNGKMKELDAYSCYSLAINKRFYIDRAIGFSFDANSNKKQKDGKNTNKKGSVWSPVQSDEEVDLKKKKQKKQQESEDEEEEVEEVTPVKAVAKKAQGKASKQNGKAEKTKKKPAKEITPEQTDEEDAEEEEEEEVSEIEEEKEDIPKRKPSRQAGPVIKSSEVNQKKGKKNQELQSNERLHCTKETYKIILSNCELTPSQKSAMEKLGAHFTDDITDNFYIVLMDTFKRRAKLLVGLNSGAKIISKEWVEDCIKEKELIPKLDKYFLEISKADSKQFDGFDLDAIQKAKGKKPYSLFAKYSFILPDDAANNNDLIAIIESGNGIIVPDEDEAQGSKSKTTLIELMSKENYKKNKAKLSKSIKYADPEFVLLSSLKQEVQEQLFFN